MSRPRAVLGLDIGGSKTLGILSIDGQVVAEAWGDGANLASTTLAEAAATLDAVLAKLRHPDIGVVYAGAAGANTEMAHNRLHSLLLPRFEQIPLFVVPDTDLILAAAQLSVGAVLISGTGSAAWGRNADGVEVRAGGWGYLLGDEGGGYGMARAALRHALALSDAAREPDALTAALVSHCGLAGPAELLNAFYTDPSRRRWALVANVVLELAAQGEPAARQIVAASVTELVAAGLNVCRRLEMIGPLVLAGGLIAHHKFLEEAVRSRLVEHGVTDIRLLEQEPVYGTLVLAARFFAAGSVLT